MFCFIAVFGTIFLSDSLLSRIRFRLLLIRFFFTCLVISRVSPVPGHTFHTYRSPYTGGFSLVLFQFLPNFHGLRPIEQGSTSSFLLLLREIISRNLQPSKIKACKFLFYQNPPLFCQKRLDKSLKICGEAD